MFIPNVRFTYRKRVGHTVHGKARLGPEKPGFCGIIRLEEDSAATSVRTDSSASRKSAMEESITARILVPAYIKLEHGDVISVQGYRLTVQSVWPRTSVLGVLDHWQLDLTTYKD